MSPAYRNRRCASQFKHATTTGEDADASNMGAIDDVRSLHAEKCRRRSLLKFLQEALEEIRGFTNKRYLIVENGGHNLYEADQRIQDAVIVFFKGEETPRRIVFDPPKFALPP